MLVAAAWRWRTTAYLASALIANAGLALWAAVRLLRRGDWWADAAAAGAAAGLGIVGALYLAVGLPDVDTSAPRGGGLLAVSIAAVGFVPALAGLRAGQR